MPCRSSSPASPSSLPRSAPASWVTRSSAARPAPSLPSMRPSRERRYGRLLSLLEAALWVAGGLIVAQALQLLPRMPAGYAISGWTAIGGALLGLGAYINGACVFGSIARFGSGEWAYVVTPIGFYLGCLSVVPLFGVPMPQRALRPIAGARSRRHGSRSSSSPLRSGASSGRGPAATRRWARAGTRRSRHASGRRTRRRR